MGASRGWAGVIGVDWGTSSFRLWVMAPDGTVTGESRGPQGMIFCQQTGFRPVLDDHLAQAGAPADLPVLICGMAGARQGWAEVAYVDLPARPGSIARGARRIPDATRDIRILPGLARRDPARPDVMRGEETQLLGLVRSVPDGLVCMPGTHCKWARITTGAVTDFHSFMTGELFQILQTHSTLRHALPDGQPTLPDDAAYLDAVDQALTDPAMLLDALFGVRAADLLRAPDPAAARARLSGLLIGSEIGRMVPRIGPQRVTLLGQRGLGALYLAALRCAGHDPRIRDAEDTTRAGLLAAALAIWKDPT